MRLAYQRVETNRLRKKERGLGSICVNLASGRSPSEAQSRSGRLALHLKHLKKNSRSSYAHSSSLNSFTYVALYIKMSSKQHTSRYQTSAGQVPRRMHALLVYLS